MCLNLRDQQLNHSCIYMAMYSVGNKVNNHVIPLYGDITRLITVVILKCKEIPNHYFVYQEQTNS